MVATKRGRGIMIYWIPLLFILMILPECMRLAALDRGYQAYGGEILLPILAILLVFLISDVVEFFKKEQEQEAGDKE